MPKRFLNADYNLFLPRYWFGQVDSRPLALFRILFGALLLKDALFHLPLAHWFYSDSGIVPRRLLWEGLARVQRFSLMDALPTDWMALAFFLLWVLVLCCLIIGWRTRLMTVLNFLIVLSIHERNIFVLTGADTVIRVLSFWMMFVALGQYYALDSARARLARYARSRSLDDLRAADTPQTTFAFPLRLMQIQIALVYLFTFFLKLPGDAWRRGEALHYALQLQTLTLPTGDWLLQNAPAWLLRLGSYFSLVAEGLFVPLVFLPIRQPFMRLVGLSLVTMMHLGIAVLMAIPDFSLVMIFSYCVFLEGRWVVWVDKRLRVTRGASTIALPVVNSPLWLLLALTRKDEIEVDSGEIRGFQESSPSDAPAPENVEMPANGAPVYDAWQISDSAKGEVYIGAAAWRRAAGHMPLSRLWAWTLRWRLLRRILWALLCGIVERQYLPQPSPTAFHSELRTRNSELGTWNLELSLKRIGRLALVGLLGALMVGVIWWNVTTIETDQYRTRLIVDPVPFVLRDAIWYLGLWQGWGMFSPYPSTVDGWFVIPGEFEDGTIIDLRTGLTPVQELPRYFFGPDARWKKFEENMNAERRGEIFGVWAAYYCRLYNLEQQRMPGERLATLQIIYRYRESYPPGGTVQPYQEVMLWQHWCYPEYAPEG